MTDEPQNPFERPVLYQRAASEGSGAWLLHPVVGSVFVGLLGYFTLLPFSDELWPAMENHPIRSVNAYDAAWLALFFLGFMVVCASAGIAAQGRRSAAQQGAVAGGAIWVFAALVPLSGALIAHAQLPFIEQYATPIPLPPNPPELRGLVQSYMLSISFFWSLLLPLATAAVLATLGGAAGALVASAIGGDGQEDRPIDDRAWALASATVAPVGAMVTLPIPVAALTIAVPGVFGFLQASDERHTMPEFYDHVMLYGNLTIALAVVALVVPLTLLFVSARGAQALRRLGAPRLSPAAAGWTLTLIACWWRVLRGSVTLVERLPLVELEEFTTPAIAYLPWMLTPSALVVLTVIAIGWFRPPRQSLPPRATHHAWLEGAALVGLCALLCGTPFTLGWLGFGLESVGMLTAVFHGDPPNDALLVGFYEQLATVRSGLQLSFVLHVFFALKGWFGVLIVAALLHWDPWVSRLRHRVRKD